jgi:class 3 adenylate cyclase/tetratricopeptide (TPR) repeat protein
MTACLSCGTPSPPGDRFCSNCGAPLPATAGTGERGGRRIVTALFADVSGSTAVGERLDPEDFAEVIGEALAVLVAAVERYEGTVARLMGDGLLAFFGAPVAHEDDPERAARAALDMATAFAAHREAVVARLRRTGVELGDAEYRLRVGINTGPVVVGDVGSSLSSEYTALGDAVNLAARLEQTAPPGTIQVSEATLRRIRHVVDTVPLGPIAVKGKRHPVEAHRIVGLSSQRGRERGLGREAPLVGRAAELAVLSEAVDGVVEGQGGIVVLLGEAGLGKTRLLGEALARSRSREGRLAWYQTTLLSFESTRAYAAARGVLAAALGPGGAGEEVLALDHVPPERRTRLVEVVRSLARSGIVAAASPDPDSVRRDIHEAMTEFWRGMTVEDGSAHPVVLVVDDLHWADVASTDLVANLFALTDAVPLLIVCSTRPERRGPGWRLKLLAETDFPHRFRQIWLDPLDGTESARLVEELVAVARLPAALVSAVVERAEGNPFFVEELVRELIDTGVLVGGSEGWDVSSAEPGLRLPESLQTLLRARFDRLDRDSRDTLEAAAVIGRVFRREVLARVRPDPDLDLRLGDLLRSGILLGQGDPHHRAYSFRHALMQEAAYESILVRRRRAVHRLVAEAIEELYPDRAVEWAPVLAHHYAEAGEHGRAAGYSLTAGDTAAAVYALADALGHYQRGLDTVDESVPMRTVVCLHRGRGRMRDLVGDIDGAQEDLATALAGARSAGERRLEWEVLIALGELWAARDYRRTGGHYREALELARAAGDREMIGTSLNKLGNWHVNADLPAAGVALHEEALRTFEEIGSQADLAATHDLLGMASVIGGDTRRSLHHFDRALELFRAAGDRAGLATVLTSRALGAPNYEALAEPVLSDGTEALASIEEALDLVLDMGWRAGEAYARFNRSQLLACRGDLGGALDSAAQSLRIATEIGHDQWTVGALLCLGAAEMEAMAFEASRVHLAEARERAEALDSRNWILLASGMSAIELAAEGDLVGGRRLVEEASRVQGASSFLAHRLCRLAEAMIELEAGQRAAAAAIADDLIGLATKVVPEPVVPVLHLVRGRALAPDDPGRAAADLGRGIAGAERTSFRVALWRLHAAAALVAAGEEAGAHREAAWSVVESMAATLDQEMAATLRERARAVIGG